MLSVTQPTNLKLNDVTEILRIEETGLRNQRCLKRKPVQSLRTVRASVPPKFQANLQPRSSLSIQVVAPCVNGLRNHISTSRVPVEGGGVRPAARPAGWDYEASLQRLSMVRLGSSHR